LPTGVNHLVARFASSALIQAKEFLAYLEENGVEALNPRPLPCPPENPEETLRATVEQTRREIVNYRRKLTDCANRYLAEKGW
jgi:acetyl-CoA carboxylase carboxyltransferase component